MNRSQQHSIGLRLTAAVVMFAWLIGQTLCFHHCAKHSSAKGGQECCTKKSFGPTKSPSDQSKMVCGSLMFAKLETKASLPEVAAIPQPLFTLVTLFILPATAIEPGLPVSFRTRPRVDWVFLPEVALGAALRSLAPPALA